MSAAWTRPITIGTRGSKLALAQTDLVRSALLEHHPRLEVHVHRITTKGDVMLEQSVASIGEKALFVAEIEQALRTGKIDLAVHSAKDLPADQPQDLRLATFLQRADPRDVLVSPNRRLSSLPPGARVATSSPRRECQLRALRRDISVIAVRGNVDTRLRRLAGGEFDALLLAAAGLLRLGRAGEASEWLAPEVMLPAVGQGALAIETRADDSEVTELVSPLEDLETSTALTAERAFLSHLGAGCSAAVGGYAVVEDGRVIVHGLVGHPSGKAVRGTRVGSVAAAAAVGASLAKSLLSAGGAELLAECERTR